MRVNVYVFKRGNFIPTYIGYIEADHFDADYFWKLCNWSAWSEQKPECLHADISSCSHGICFANPETKRKWLALSFGGLVGDSSEILRYVNRNKDSVIWT